MPTIGEMRAHVRDKAVDDEDFRMRLIADPKSVISQELGILIPEYFDIQVHEDSANTAHLILPPPARLTEDDLAQVAGANYNPGEVPHGRP